MTQRRIFAFLWPDPPTGPLDGNARQVRLVRASPRGPLRVVLLGILTLAAFTVALVGALLIVSSPSVTGGLILLCVLAPLLALTARAWQLGTYVNDEGVRVIRLFSTVGLLWSDVEAVVDTAGCVSLVGDGRTVPTHVRRMGLDHLGSPQSYDIARDRIANWWRAA